MRHPASLNDDSLLKDCEITRVRRSGPGGQHRNKVETGIVIEHRPTGTTAEANERRRQSENKKNALFRLRIRLAVEFRTEIDHSNRPSELWKSRIANGKISVNPTHEDFPALLAEAMDVLEESGYDTKSSANLLAITSSQLVRLLRLEPRAFTHVNRKRKERGLHNLKSR